MTRWWSGCTSTSSVLLLDASCGGFVLVTGRPEGPPYWETRKASRACFSAWPLIILVVAWSALPAPTSQLIMTLLSQAFDSLEHRTQSTPLRDC
jgi:hypothetical protein